MKLDLNVYKSKHGWSITCCNKKDVKLTKSKSGRCWVELNCKCNKCGMRGKLTHWHYESYIPTKEEKEMGSERQLERNNYTFEVLKSVVTKQLD